ncbi:MAG: 2-hydroxyacyl-CoA dehydratase family protein [Dehalococcoidia bacterium]|jgi:hypothetical protein
MNILEKLIKNTESILQEMDKNPDPNAMKSTRLGHEIELEGYKEILQEWQEGKPLMTHFPTNGLARALGTRRVVYEDLVFVFPDPADAKRYRQKAREMGLPDYTCEFFTLPTAAVELGELPPSPGIGVVCPEGICRLLMFHLKVFAEHHAEGKPTFEVDIPHEYNEESIKYLADQLGGLIKFVEKNVPGLKYDEAKHKEIIETYRIFHQYLMKEWELRKKTPLPMSNIESYESNVMHFDPYLYSTPEKVLEYWRQRVEDLEERVAKGVDKKEELRVIWVLTIPVYVNIFPLLDRLNVSLVSSVFPGSRPGFWGDDKEFGRKLAPLEEEARALFFGAPEGSLAEAMSVVGMCKDLKADAIICQQSCLHFGSPAGLISDIAEKELGVPTLILPTDFVDPAAVPAAEFESRVEEFVNMAKARKK